MTARKVSGLTYCYGDVYSACEPGRIELARHCWIEVGRERDRSRLVVDLTVDQLDMLRQHEVLYGWHDELQTSLGVDYRARTRLTPLQLQYDSVQERLAILKQQLAVVR